MPVSATDLADYRGLLAEVNRLAQEDLIALWRQFEHLDPDGLWEALRLGVPEIVELYRSTAAETAGIFYEETQGVPFTMAELETASQVNRKQLESNLRWAVFNPGNEAVLGLVAGIVQKHVIDGSRQYVLPAFEAAGEEWWRAARPGACAFCRMLATRSVKQWRAYTSADAASRVQHSKGSLPKGSEFHPNCSCLPVRASEYEPPDYVEAWTAEYEAAVSMAGDDRFNTAGILSAMRTISGDSH